MQKKLTEGNITKNIFLFAIPILIGNGLQRVYTLVDTIMVGQLLGTNELAAVGAASVIAHLFIDFCFSFTSGFSIITAQHFGANNEPKLKKSLAATYVLSFFLFFILTIAGFALIKPLLLLTKAPSEIIPLAVDYLKVMVAGLFCSLIYNLMAHVLRSLGDSSTPLFFLVISVLLNIALDYICIAVFNWGVAGAAIATVFSQGVSGFACVIFCIFKRKILAVKKSDFSFDKEIYKSLVTQGSGMGLMLSVVSLSTLILQTGINSLGTDMIAGYMAGRKYLELFMMPGAAISMTSASFVSQHFGAKIFDRIKKGVHQMILITWVWAFISTFIIFIFGRGIVTSVTGKGADEEIIKCGIQYLRIGIVFFLPLDVLCVIRAALQGMNHKKTPVLSSCIELAVKTTAVFVFVPYLGFLGICIAEPLVWLINGLWLYPVYCKMFKKEKQLAEKLAVEESKENI